MFIKKLLLLPLLLGLIACAEEDRLYLDEPVVQMKGSGCLATSLSKFDQYFEGGLKNQEVEAFWDCLDTALISVERYVKGDAEGGNFKTKALKNFISVHFLKSGKPDGIELTDAMVHEVMEIKRLFLGGTTEYLTRKEIRKVHRVFRELKAHTTKLNPVMGVLFNNNKAFAPSASELSQAVTILSETLEGIGGLLSFEQNAYKVESFERFVRELHKIVGDPNQPDQISWLKYVPAFQELKNAFLLTKTDQIESDEWQTLSRLVGQGFSLYYRSKYFLKIKALYSLDTSSEIPKILDNAFYILKEALERRADKAFSTTEFIRVIDALDANGLLPQQMSKEDIINIWTLLVDRILVVKEHADRNPNGLGSDELDFARLNWNNWDLAQKFLLGGVVDETTENIKNLKSFLDIPWAMKLDSDGRLIFDEVKKAKSDLEITTEVNLYRAVFNMLVDSYSEDGILELDIDQLEKATTDLKPLLVQMGLVGEDEVGFHKTLFLYSNLFMPISNGNERISSLEITYFVSYVFKAETASNLFLANLDQACLIDADESFDLDCFRRQFRDKFVESFRNMPNIIRYTEGFEKDKDWTNFTKDFEKAVSSAKSKKGKIRKSEIAQIFMLTQFIETIMMRFDTDANAMLDLQEGLVASPLFEFEIHKLSNIDDPEELKTLFTYLLKYGKAPDPKDPISLVRYLAWKLNKKSWKLETNRGTIVKILSSFNQ